MLRTCILRGRIHRCRTGRRHRRPFNSQARRDAVLPTTSRANSACASFQPRPALVPLCSAARKAGWTALAGVSTEVIAQAGHAQFREKLLVTHRGLSGPAVLQASSYWQRGQTADRRSSRRTPRCSASMLRARRAPRYGSLRQALRTVLPQRLADRLVDIGAPNGWTNAALDACERRLHRWEFHPTGTEGFAKAEVTAGGVDTADLNSQTMEARYCAGPLLYRRSC